MISQKVPVSVLIIKIIRRRTSLFSWLDHWLCTSEIICGQKSFVVNFGDHLRRCTILLNQQCRKRPVWSEIICGWLWESFAALYNTARISNVISVLCGQKSFVVDFGDHLWRCTILLNQQCRTKKRPVWSKIICGWLWGSLVALYNTAESAMS